MARILVVDDEKSIRITLRAFLLEADYEVGVAEDAEEALGMLAAQDFDVVLSDIIMPRITGVRLLQSITETALHAQVILMTGEPTVETASEAVRAGAFDYLSKPIDKEQLLRTVANAVKVKTLDDERRRLEEENRLYREDLEHLVEERTKALKQSKARLVRAQSIVHMGNWVWDIEANTQHWSDEVYRVFGLEPRSIEPSFEAFLRMVHPDDRDYVQRKTKDVLAQQEDSGTEYRIIRPDGEVRTLWAESIVSFDETGKPIRMEGIMMDITRRRQAQERETHLGRILEDSLNEIYIFDADTLRFIQVNRGGRENLGYSLGDLREMTPLDLKPEFTRESFAQLIEPLHTGEVEMVQFTTVHRRKDSSLYPVEIHLQRSTFESTPAYVAIVLDITRRIQAEEELIKAKEHTEEMNRLKSAFLANMSHEFRTPLAGIIGIATLLAQEVPEQLREDVRHIEESGQRLLDTLSSVLDLSMLEAGSLHLNSEIINVADEVQQQVALLCTLAEQKGLPLRILAPPDRSQRAVGSCRPRPPPEALGRQRHQVHHAR